MSLRGKPRNKPKNKKTKDSRRISGEGGGMPEILLKSLVFLFFLVFSGFPLPLLAGLAGWPVSQPTWLAGLAGWPASLAWLAGLANH